MFKNIIKLILLVVILTNISCNSRKNIAYLQNIDTLQKSEKSGNFEPILQNDDLLSIIVAADQPEATLPFNLPQIQGNYQINENQDGIKTYLIDSNGFIDFPVIGKIQLAGLSRSQAITKLENEIKEYVTKPIINLRILNYKISVLGEVSRPGNFKISSERITLLEALSLAGDLTIYGRRDNVLLVREINGVKSFNRIDITKADFLNSPYYYLAQNDVVVVEPNKTKINSSAVGPNIPIILSGISILSSIILIIITRN